MEPFQGVRHSDQEMMVRDRGPTVTVMRQRFDLPDRPGIERTGLFVSVSAEPYATGRVRPHEPTDEERRDQRLGLLRAGVGVTEPVLLLSPDPGDRIAGLMGSVTGRDADERMERQGVEMELWLAGGAEAEDALAEAGSAPLYLAEGHDLYEAAVAWGAEQDARARVLAFVVPLSDPGLVVKPVHRVVRGGPVDQEALLKRIAPHFQLQTAEQAECTIVWPGRVDTHLGCVDTVPPSEEGEQDHPAGTLPTITQVDRHLVQPLLAAAGPDSVLEHATEETAARIRVAEGSASAAVVVDPRPPEELVRAADEGRRLPPRSTFFYPRVPGGIVMLPGG